MMCGVSPAGYPHLMGLSHLISAIGVIDSKSVLDFVTKPEAPTRIDDKLCAIDTAIIRG